MEKTISRTVKTYTYHIYEVGMDGCTPVLINPKAMVYTAPQKESKIKSDYCTNENSGLRFFIDACEVTETCYSMPLDEFIKHACPVNRPDIVVDVVVVPTEYTNQ